MMARQTRDQISRLRALTEAQAVLGWSVILVLGALVGTIYVNQASQIASVGRRVQILQNDLSELKRENAMMERQIAEAQKLERLKAEAVSLGFIPADSEDIEYIIVSDYPLEIDENFVLEPLPTAVPLPPPPETISEAFLLSLRGRISGFVEGGASE
jgi:hypothetical protein